MNAVAREGLRYEHASRVDAPSTQHCEVVTPDTVRSVEPGIQQGPPEVRRDSLVPNFFKPGAEVCDSYMTGHKLPFQTMNARCSRWVAVPAHESR